MKKLILILALLPLATVAVAQTRNFYGSDGSYQGSARSNGNTTNYYGSDGSYQGNSRSNGNNTNYYGSDGSYQGTTRYR